MRLCVGILAHVDAGKTTLSEALLYTSGAIRAQGRVDYGTAFLDNFAIERQRGITIFSKQAVFTHNGVQVTLLDTPGHVDFSTETERTLDVLDCAVLVVSAPEGVQSHTVTLWNLLRRRRIPTLLFINKMDMPGTDRDRILGDLSRELEGVFFDYASPDWDTVAMGSERLLDRYLETGALPVEDIRRAVADCEIFPCWFGAALKLRGIEPFLDGLTEICPRPEARDEFGAKVFKITHDEQGAKVAHMKITGGALRARDALRGDGWEFRVTQLRRYSGGRFTQIREAFQGDVVAVAGLEAAFPGMGLGAEPAGEPPDIEPVLRYTVTFPEGTDFHRAFTELKKLQDEEPALDVTADTRAGTMAVRLMGQVQLEVLRELLRERAGLEARFDAGQVLYRETIANTVEGVGHYEPLRHYAEVHLLLEPGEPGSGVVIASSCSEDDLAGSWQRLIMTHLAEKRHLGVLTGSPITDIKITLTSGRAHEKHTEGGDFREATYRAVRQGLMNAAPVLLEPWYDYRIETPPENVGRVLGDLRRMGAKVPVPETREDGARLAGSAPVSKIGNYAAELAAFTKGRGRMTCVPGGYRPCPDGEVAEIVERIGYDPEADLENSPDSVFCRHGAALAVRWYDVPKYMHLESDLAKERRQELEQAAERYVKIAATDKELMAIFESTYGPVRKPEKKPEKKTRPEPAERERPKRRNPLNDGREFVLVDGYNMLFSWRELKSVAEDNVGLARDRLIEILRNYQGFRQCAVILVFDAYKVKGGQRHIERAGDFSVVYTKEAETADTYIEQATYDLAKKHFVRVATSDGLEQMIILGNGALRVPARVFEAEVKETEKAVRDILRRYQG